MEAIAVLILAAGSSSRMKTPKQLLEINGKTLIGNIIENTLKSKVKDVYCILGDHYDEIKRAIEIYDINYIINHKFKDGISSSIVEGIKYLKQKNYNAALILLADQPNVSTIHINTLIDLHEIHKNKIIASKYSNNFGVPAIFPKYWFSQLLELKGDKGAKDLLNAKKTEIISVAHIDLTDIDTPLDYSNYIKSL